MRLTCLFLLATSIPAQVDKALTYLATEVQAWSKDNHCFSCHNNGDGARALYLAHKLGRTVNLSKLEPTAVWLQQPERWASAGANPGISDKLLASIQYAAALAEAFPSTRSPLLKAAAIVALGQAQDGSWKVDALGSPATYGTALATWLASNVLKQADPERFAASIARANACFDTFQPGNVPDAAASVLAGKGGVELLLNFQNQNGGWGPEFATPAWPTSII